MRRFEISSGEISILVKEISSQLPRRCHQVYRGADGSYVLRLRGEGDVRDLRILPGRVLYLASGIYTEHGELDDLSRRLRERLKGSLLEGSEWVRGERIIIFSFRKWGERLSLVVELFPGGGLHLIDENQLIAVSSNLKVGEKYEVREGRATVASGQEALGMLKRLEGKTRLGVALARDLGLGSKYSNEVAALSGVNPEMKIRELSEKDLGKLAESVESVLQRFESPKPRIYRLPDSEVVHAPFPLKSMEAESIIGEGVQSLNEAVRIAYENYLARSLLLESLAKREEQMKKLKKEIEDREELITRLQTEAEKRKHAASLLYMKLGELKESWDRLKRGETVPSSVRRVDRESGTAVIALDDEEVVLTLREPVSKQVDRLFHESKKIAAGVEKLRNEVEGLRMELRRLEASRLPETTVGRPIEKRRGSEWFKRYRWSFTSGGRLVVLGRDSASNIRLLKKHLEPHDLVLHADVRGSPVVILKSGADSGPEEIHQAATVCASYSRAWREGLSSISVYWVSAEQISFSPPTSTYLPRGSFIVRPPKNYLETELRLAIGYSPRLGLIAGAEEWVSRESDLYVIIAPGNDDIKALHNDFIRMISTKNGAGPPSLTLRDLQALLPYGRGRVVKGFSSLKSGD
jgi:predicted ribosome quality control (RQC) complex YloA/Tae2 family protein